MNYFFDLSKPETYPLSNPDFANYLNTKPTKLLMACQNMQKDQSKISGYAKIIFNQVLLPKLKKAFNENQFSGYHFIKAAWLLNKAHIDPDRIKIELEKFIQKCCEPSTLKRKTLRQLNKLSISFKKFEISENKPEWFKLHQITAPYIKKLFSSSDNIQSEINPLEWFAHSRCLRQLLFESPNPRFALPAKTLTILNEHIYKIKMEQFRVLPPHWVPRHPLPQTLDEWLSFHSETSYLEFPYLSEELSKFIAQGNLIDENNVLKILHFAFTYRVYDLIKKCCDYLNNSSRGLELSFNDNHDLLNVALKEINENNTVLLESLSNYICSFNISTLTSLNSLQEAMVFKNVKAVYFFPKASSWSPRLHKMFPNAKKCYLLQLPSLNIGEPPKPWPSVQVVKATPPQLWFFTHSTPNMEDFDTKNLDLCQNLFPNLKIFISQCSEITEERGIILVPRSTYDTETINLSKIPSKLITDDVVTFLVQEFPYTKHLLLPNSTQITDQGVKAIAQSRRLTSLSLGECTLITDESIKFIVQNCTYLRCLALSNCTLIKQETWKMLKDLKHLKQLSLTNYTISPKELEQLRQALPNCSIESTPPADDPNLSVNKKSKLERENI